VGVGVVAVVAIALVMTGVFPPRPRPSPSVAASATPVVSLGPPASLIPAPGFPSARPDGSYPSISRIGCDALEQTAFHIHAHLAIRFGGELHSVPEGIGVRETCLYWIHTHANNGVIHVEAPRDVAPTIGKFFDIWGEVLAPRQVIDRPLEPNEGLFVFVDGRRYDGDPRGIALTDRMIVEIQVGIAPFEPLPYEWPAVPR
jgi:hypothetical protein